MNLYFKIQFFRFSNKIREFQEFKFFKIHFFFLTKIRILEYLGWLVILDMIEIKCGIAFKSQNPCNCKQNQKLRHLLSLESNHQLHRICTG